MQTKNITNMKHEWAERPGRMARTRSLSLIMRTQDFSFLICIDPGVGGTWVFFGWVCAALDSKLAPRSKKKFP